MSMRPAGSDNDGFDVVVGEDGALTVPATELARHSVAPGAHLRLVPERADQAQRVSAFGYLSAQISAEAAEALAEGIAAGKADRIEALGLS